MSDDDKPAGTMAWGRSATGGADRTVAAPPPRPRPTSPAAAVSPAAQPEAVRPLRAVPDSPAAAPAKRGKRKRKSDGVGVSVPIGVRARLRAYLAANPGANYTDITLDAIEACYGELAGLVDGRGPRRSGPLFVGRQPQREQYSDAQVHVQITLRPHQQDLDVIDDLANEHAAGNRSTLIARVLDRYLPPATDTVSAPPIGQ